MLKRLSLALFVCALFVGDPVLAFAADGAVGNEVLDTANTTLTRTGSGTAGSPYKLELNLGNANTWTGSQTFNAAVTAAGGFTSTGTVTANSTFNANGTLNASGPINLGDGGDTASLSGTTVTVKVGDDNVNAFLAEQGAIKYLQITTTNGNEAISFGNSTTNPIFNFLGSGAASFGGTVTVSGNLIAANGLTATSATVTGNTALTPYGTADVTVATDSDSKLVVTGLTTESGTGLCLNASNEVVLCTSSGGSSVTLQDAYNTGNAINTTDGRDITFNLNDTATDSNFVVNLDASNTVTIAKTNGAGGSSPAQLLSLQNQDTDLTVAKGLSINSEVGGIVTAIDVSDAEIATALAAGTNDLSGTNWAISGSTGNVQTSGDVAVGGGDVTTTAATGSLFNTSATTVNIAGAATSLSLGATVGTTTVRSSTLSFPNANTITANSATALVDSIYVGGGYGSTGVTVSNNGNLQANGNMTIDGTGTFAGNVTAANDVAVNGGDVTTTASTATLFNTNATTLNVGGSATSVNIGASVGTTTINNSLTTVGLLNADSGITVPAGQTLTGNGSVAFSPNATNDVTINTDIDSTFVLTGLATATGDGLCIDASNNVVICSGTPSDRRLKKNITKLTDVLPRVLKAQGVRYDLLKEADSAPGEGKNIGFIAQDLEELFPEVVKTDANGIKSVDYEKMTAVLVESTKEQQQQIDALKAEITELKTLIKEH